MWQGLKKLRDKKLFRRREVSGSLGDASNEAHEEAGDVLSAGSEEDDGFEAPGEGTTTPPLPTSSGAN